MPRVRITHKRIELSSRYVLLILTLVCVLLMVVSYTTDIIQTPLSYVSGYLVVPFQKGIKTLGSTVATRADDLKELRKVMEQNNKLQAELDELKIENYNLVQDKYELNELRDLYELDRKYSGYEKIGARVIAGDAGNWFSNFVIDKGEVDGIEKDMNVMSGSGLVGIVTEVGPNWAGVRSIIDDASNVSAQVLSTSDHLMVTGDLLLMEQGQIRFSQLVDEEGTVANGDVVVTSDISDKYLPGINIGYISSVETDNNNLTRSGTITPGVDFAHLDVVLIIKELKSDKFGE
ncbi:MAG: rod shape-determining protein MreC [Lachnospiraceae bacterium]|nr:rod shape-determining protein MreC [Lachnospiraceae bacterium]